MDRKIDEGFSNGDLRPKWDIETNSFFDMSDSNETDPK